MCCNSGVSGAAIVFLDDTPQLGPVVVRGGKPNNVLYFSGREDVTNASNLEFHSLGAGKIDRNIDPYIIDITYEEDYKLSSHEGEEFIYVLEGEISLLERFHTLRKSNSWKLYLINIFSEA